MYVYKPKKAVAQARHAGPITMGVGSGFSASSALEADGRSPATRNVASRKGKFSNQSHSLQKDGYTYKDEATASVEQLLIDSGNAPRVIRQSPSPKASGSERKTRRTPNPRVWQPGTVSLKPKRKGQRDYAELARAQLDDADEPEMKSASPTLGDNSSLFSWKPSADTARAGSRTSSRKRAVRPSVQMKHGDSDDGDSREGSQTPSRHQRAVNASRVGGVGAGPGAESTASLKLDRVRTPDAGDHRGGGSTNRFAEERSAILAEARAQVRQSEIRRAKQRQSTPQKGAPRTPVRPGSGDLARSQPLLATIDRAITPVKQDDGLEALLSNLPPRPSSSVGGTARSLDFNPQEGLPTPSKRKGSANSKKGARSELRTQIRAELRGGPSPTFSPSQSPSQSPRLVPMPPQSSETTLNDSASDSVLMPPPPAREKKGKTEKRRTEDKDPKLDEDSPATAAQPPVVAAHQFTDVDINLSGSDTEGETEAMAEEVAAVGRISTPEKKSRKFPEKGGVDTTSHDEQDEQNQQDQQAEGNQVDSATIGETQDAPQNEGQLERPKSSRENRQARYTAILQRAQNRQQSKDKSAQERKVKYAEILARHEQSLGAVSGRTRARYQKTISDEAGEEEEDRQHPSKKNPTQARFLKMMKKAKTRLAKAKNLDFSRDTERDDEDDEKDEAEDKDDFSSRSARWTVRLEATRTPMTRDMILEAAQEVELPKVFSLNLAHKNLGEISTVLQDCANLRSIDLSYNSISKIDNLVGLRQLREIKCVSNQLTHMMDLKNSSMLQVLKLDDNYLEDIKGIASLSHLQTLSLSRNNLKAFPLGAVQPSITSLDLSYNRLSDIGGIRRLDGLTELFLNKTGMTDAHIRSISRCSALDELHLANNSITRCEQLSTLTILSVLNLSGNYISNLNQLPKLPELSELDISGNQLTSLDGIASLFPNLDILIVSDNHLTHTDRLVAALSDLEQLAELSVAGNPMMPAASSDADHSGSSSRSSRKTNILYLLEGLPSLTHLDGESRESLLATLVKDANNNRPTSARPNSSRSTQILKISHGDDDAAMSASAASGAADTAQESQQTMRPTTPALGSSSAGSSTPRPSSARPLMRPPTASGRKKQAVLMPGAAPEQQQEALFSKITKDVAETSANLLDHRGRVNQLLNQCKEAFEKVGMETKIGKTASVPALDTARPKTAPPKNERRLRPSTSHVSNTKSSSFHISVPSEQERQRLHQLRARAKSAGSQRSRIMQARRFSQKGDSAGAGQKTPTMVSEGCQTPNFDRPTTPMYALNSAPDIPVKATAVPGLDFATLQKLDPQFAQMVRNAQQIRSEVSAKKASRPSTARAHRRDPTHEDFEGYKTFRVQQATSTIITTTDDDDNPIPPTTNPTTSATNSRPSSSSLSRSSISSSSSRYDGQSRPQTARGISNEAAERLSEIKRKQSVTTTDGLQSGWRGPTAASLALSSRPQSASRNIRAATFQSSSRPGTASRRSSTTSAAAAAAPTKSKEVATPRAEDRPTSAASSRPMSARSLNLNSRSNRRAQPRVM